MILYQHLRAGVPNAVLLLSQDLPSTEGPHSQCCKGKMRLHYGRKLLKSTYQKSSAHSCVDEDGTSTCGQSRAKKSEKKEHGPEFQDIRNSLCIMSSCLPRSHLFPLLSAPTWPRSPRSGSACIGTLVQQHPTAQPPHGAKERV